MATNGPEIALDEWIAQRATDATLMLRNCAEVSPSKRGGVPVLKGTRFTLAQVLAEIAEGKSVPELAEDFELDLELIKEFLHGLAILLDRSYSTESDARSRASDDYLPARPVHE
jgi:uncharacterized protein (DUF433 family)